MQIQSIPITAKAHEMTSVQKSAKRIELDGHTLDFDKFPLDLQREFIQFYDYLTFKTTQKRQIQQNNDNKQNLIDFLNQFNATLPKDYKFDRDEIYERGGLTL